MVGDINRLLSWDQN